ncbi:MAG: hypothetical protein KBF64_00605 [Anaerolineaceae bacterium]|nr:hypothetical protein [Anaerolineaceae bacterium]
MANFQFLREVPFAITVCDKTGVILEMNDKSAVTFAKDGGRALIGQSLLDCHPEDARRQILNMIDKQSINVYTIEKKGVKKLIYQCPWYQDGEFGGLVELSLELPANLPHFIRGD